MKKNQILSATPEQVRAYAHQELCNLNWEKQSPSLFVELIKNLQLKDFDPAEDYAQLNINLSTKSCLGKAAICGAFAEKFFDKTVYGCDVIVDWFREVSKVNMQSEINRNPIYLEDILMYEDPHIVLSVDGEQFEPLIKIVKQVVIHPKVEQYPLWDIVLSSLLCSHAALSDDLVFRKEALAKAATHAQTIELLYSKVALASEEGDFYSVMSLCEQILQKKKSARAMFTINSISGKYQKELTEEYTPHIFDFFRKMYNL